MYVDISAIQTIWTYARFWYSTLISGPLCSELVTVGKNVTTQNYLNWMK